MALDRFKKATDFIKVGGQKKVLNTTTGAYQGKKDYRTARKDEKGAGTTKFGGQPSPTTAGAGMTGSPITKRPGQMADRLPTYKAQHKTDVAAVGAGVAGPANKAAKSAYHGRRVAQKKDFYAGKKNLRSPTSFTVND